MQSIVVGRLFQLCRRFSLATLCPTSSFVVPSKNIDRRTPRPILEASHSRQEPPSFADSTSIPTREHHRISLPRDRRSFLSSRERRHASLFLATVALSRLLLCAQIQDQEKKSKRLCVAALCFCGRGLFFCRRQNNFWKRGTRSSFVKEINVWIKTVRPRVLCVMEGRGGIEPSLPEHYNSRREIIIFLTYLSVFLCASSRAIGGEIVEASVSGRFLKHLFSIFSG